MTMKGFPRLLVPRPPPNTKPSAGVRGDRPPGYVKTPPQEAVMHACRPVDHAKPSPRIVPPTPAGHIPVRPVAEQTKPVERDRPAFLTRGTREEKPAGERETRGIGRVTTPPAPPTVRVPAASRPQALTPADIPWNW